jgi:hypothetical protein
LESKPGLLDVVKEHPDYKLELVLESGLDPRSVSDSDWPDSPDAHGLLAAGRYLTRGSLVGLRLALDAKRAAMTTSSATYRVDPEGEPITQAELSARNIQALLALPPEDFKQAAEFFRLLRSPFQLHLYLQAIEELRSGVMTKPSLAAHQVLMNLFYAPADARPIAPIISHISKGELAGHPNESDLLMLLTDPTMRRADAVGPNAVRDMFREEIGRDSSFAYWAVSRIGILTNSFKRWKADSMTFRERDHDGSEQVIYPALFESFGAKRIAPNREYKKPGDHFGVQFVFRADSANLEISAYGEDGHKTTRSISQESMIVKRQGYMLATNPKHGVLIIRNSSPYFGRDLLARPWYFIDSEAAAGLSTDEILYPTPALFELGNTSYAGLDSETCAHMNWLLDELIGFHDHFAKFKYDTDPSTSWAKEEGSKKKGSEVLVGGHCSRGFGEFVKRVELLHAQAEVTGESLELGFVNPDLLPEKTYAFSTEGTGNNKTLLVDRSVVADLHTLCASDGSGKLQISHAVKDFFQQAGLNQRGELVVIME